MTAKTVTVFGGSGFVGRNLVQRLGAEGWRVRVAVRRPIQGNAVTTVGAVGQVQMVQANVRNMASVEAAVEGASLVINLVGLLVQGGKQKFMAVHGAGAENVARAAAAAGVDHLIHMSAIGASAKAPSVYGQSKAAGEAAVREAFPSATIIRPSAIFGKNDSFITRFANLTRMMPVIPLIGFGKTQFQPIHINDVVDTFMAVITAQDARGRTYEIGGPDVLSLAEIKKAIAHDMNRSRMFVPWPMWVAKINGFFLKMPYTFLRIPAFLTIDQVKMLQSDSVVGVSGEEGIGTATDLGLDTMIPLATVLPEYLTRFRKHGQYDSQPAVGQT